MQSFDPEEITRLIRHRRSVFPAQYSGEIIQKEIIEEILENANWAPTHKLSEPWRFTVFSGAGLQTLGNFMSEVYKEEAEKNNSFDAKKFEKLKNKPLKVSHVISIGMKRDDMKRLPEIEEIEAVACAVQNMYLTATAHGVGCYWGSGGITYFESAKQFFGLKADDRLLGFLYLGIPKLELPSGKRKNIEDKVNWVSG